MKQIPHPTRQLPAAALALCAGIASGDTFTANSGTLFFLN